MKVLTRKSQRRPRRRSSPYTISSLLSYVGKSPGVGGKPELVPPLSFEIMSESETAHTRTVPSISRHSAFFDSSSAQSWTIRQDLCLFSPLSLRRRTIRLLQSRRQPITTSHPSSRRVDIDTHIQVFFQPEREQILTSRRFSCSFGGEFSFCP